MAKPQKVQFSENVNLDTNTVDHGDRKYISPSLLPAAAGETVVFVIESDAAPVDGAGEEEQV